MTREQLEEGIAADGTAEPYQGVVTNFARCEGIGIRTFDDGDGYVSVICDYGPHYIETRVLFSTLEAQGWRRPESRSPSRP